MQSHKCKIVSALHSSIIEMNLIVVHSHNNQSLEENEEKSASSECETLTVVEITQNGKERGEKDVLLSVFILRHKHTIPTCERTTRERAREIRAR